MLLLRVKIPRATCSLTIVILPSKCELVSLAERVHEIGKTSGIQMSRMIG